MNRDLHILPAADGDIEQCFRYLRDQNNLDKALRFLEGLRESFERIRQMPFIGSPRKFSATSLQNLRQWPVKGFKDFLIFYHVSDTQVEVYRVLHARQDIEAIFEERS